MASSDSAAMPEVATEAIVVVDLVESTLTSNLFGWYAVGRQAIRDLRAADAIREYKPEVVSALARALWANNQPAEAEKYLKGILRAQPSFAAGYSELKRYYMKNNRLKDAEALLLNAAEYAPRHYEFLSQLAELYQQTGRLADMAKTLERLKKEASNSPAAAFAKPSRSGMRVVKRWGEW